MNSVPTFIYPTGGVDSGTGTNVFENWYPDITWQFDGSALTWTTGAEIEWIGRTETVPDRSTPQSKLQIPTIVYIGNGDL